MYWNLVVLISESFSMPWYLKNQFPANDTLFYKFIFGKRTYFASTLRKSAASEINIAFFYFTTVLMEKK